MKKIMIVFGTRPEAIKMAPLVEQFESHRDRFNTIVCVTAQHREMLDQVLNLFDIDPQYDLNVMTDDQTLSDLTVKVLSGITKVLEKEKPDMVFVQGDTTTTFVTSLAAFYMRIPVGHVEAGLRTLNKFSPYPEEINRRLTSSMSDYHFAPTEQAKDNLIKEGASESFVFVTGNTVIDALKIVIKKHNKMSERRKWKDFFLSEHNISLLDSVKTILVTGHRRESFGGGFKRICEALSKLAKKNPGLQIIYPVHLNPNVRKPVYSILSNIRNIKLIPPLDYEPFVFLMNNSYLILTDSGGIQEEAPSLGKPVLVMRDTTERPEGVEAGTAKLVGTRTENIVKETGKLLDDRSEYERISKAVNPYGDGKASNRIVEIILRAKR
ncbi:UDP-N-acetylglucosamine 2-epimerase (non-hydrolyzing) [candidate division WS5 bacterium]|uniref:UDP-N-acetylglucosamine 2-epimerase (non-hydrolyzing) n=1 Tax=candidate division WS5 bacterium TaxID=2093353 RepID=A0A419DGG7_9BACT|nr:MAG: UDP-N-acetylglucosamine 2-epimerase (non-hydrolyzing) [candidate division WS5 bacterium]